jgi:uncharacterized membrane protein YidH (DUF202 family)
MSAAGFDDIAASRLSLERTFLSARRTLMAAVRTSFAMTTFGFTLFQVFKLGSAAKVVQDDASGRGMAMAVIALGAVLPALSLFQHERALRRLRRDAAALQRFDPAFQPADYRRGPNYLLGWIVMLLGLGALATVVVQAFAP